MRESVPPIVVLALCAATAGCASTIRCPTDRVCGNATWYTAASGPPIEGRVVIAPLTGVAGAGSDGSESITLGTRPVYLRFDLRGLDESASIERAVLSLVPHSSWHPSGVASRVIARGLTSEWTSTSPFSNAITVRPDPAGELILPGRTRTPVRIDVTEALRASREGATPFEGVALTADGATVTFAGLAIDTLASRPRLEVVQR